jgi:hypothetical protein
MNAKTNDEELTTRNRGVFAEHKCTENRCAERMMHTKGR